MSKKVLITGGAGFIGSNYARRLILRGDQVTIFDNLSRRGSQKNLDWLKTAIGKENFQFINGDIRDFDHLKSTILTSDVIVHLAAQVAVTKSVENPRDDFEINALGTLNLLEAARQSKSQPIVIYASTNKVYGGLENLEIIEDRSRYKYSNNVIGVNETHNLDFHSPYGCSKGCGDQYTRDYFRIYGMPTIVFRQSCIYGERQFGFEDQGWVAWFLIAAVKQNPISIFGDGKQVRDLLNIEDLLDAYDLAIEGIDKSAGKIYNIGGGPDYSISIWKEFSKILMPILGRELTVEYNDWRPGDQKVYISDIQKINHELGWEPKITIEEGIKKLFTWIKNNKELFV